MKIHPVLPLLKLWLYCFCNLLCRVGIHIVESLLNGIGEFLDHLWIGLQKALFSTVCRIGHIAGIYAEGSDYITASLIF